MLYDCFIFFNELELLEIRLNELNKIVDKFVIVEATKTFSGKDKELFFKKNQHLFKQFLNKIIYIVVDDFPNSSSPWDFETHQRNAISRGLKDCQPDDIIMISDVDEIPNTETIESVKNNLGIKKLIQNFYYYYLNVLVLTKKLFKKIPVPWLYGTRIVFYKEFTDAQSIRTTQEGKYIQNGGWHFSYLGDEKQIRTKIESFSHQEFNTKEITDLENIEKAITKNKDLFGRKGYKYETIRIDDTYPKYILDNLDKFKHLIKNND